MDANLWQILIAGFVGLAFGTMDRWLKYARESSYLRTRASTEADTRRALETVQAETKLEARINRMETETVEQINRIITLERQNAALTSSLAAMQSQQTAAVSETARIVRRLQLRIRASEQHILAWQRAIDPEPPEVKGRIQARIPPYLPPALDYEDPPDPKARADNGSAST